jgi:molecular chaperone DnaK
MARLRGRSSFPCASLFTVSPSSSGRVQSSHYDFLPLTLGVETQGGLSTPLVLRGTPLPVTRSETFTTASDNQKSVEITILLGESPVAAKNIRLRRLIFNHLPPENQGTINIRLQFTIHQNGRIELDAKELNTGASINTEDRTIQIKLTKEEISARLSQAEQDQEEDESYVKAIESRNKARSLIKRAENILRSSSTILADNIAQRFKN